MATTKAFLILFPLVCLSLSLLHQVCYARTNPEFNNMEAKTLLKSIGQTLSYAQNYGGPGHPQQHHQETGTGNPQTNHQHGSNGGPSNCGEKGKSMTEMKTKSFPQEYSKSLEVSSNTMGANSVRPQDVSDQRSVTFQQREAVVNDENTRRGTFKNDDGYNKK